MSTETNNIENDVLYIEQLVASNGPDIEEYKNFEQWINNFTTKVKTQQCSSEQLFDIYNAFDEVLSPQTMMGFIYQKPHEYAGDYEIIDQIYTGRVSSNPLFAKWDLFMQQHKIAELVRNRKNYFINLITRKLETSSGRLNVLNLSSGPSREVYELLEMFPTADIHFDCVDADIDSILYSRELLKKHLPKVSYEQKNILRFNASVQYDIIWSSGLFDYFNDNLVEGLLSRFYKWLKPQGEVVVGSFSPDNPSLSVMEFLDWILMYRTTEQLQKLATNADIPLQNIGVSEEPNKVNLFLHAVKN